MNVSRGNQSKIILVAVITGILTAGGIGTSVYLATRPSSQSPLTSAGEPTPTLFKLPTHKVIPTATAVPIPSELPTIFKSFRPEAIPTATPEGEEGTGETGQSGGTDTNSVEPTVEPEPTLSEDQKQEAVETLDKLDKMPEEFKKEFLQWLADL